jgi:hypothetical protein
MESAGGWRGRIRTLPQLSGLPGTEKKGTISRTLIFTDVKITSFNLDSE